MLIKLCLLLAGCLLANAAVPAGRNLRTGRSLDFNYHSHEQLEAFLTQAHASYPHLTSLYSIGKSVQGQWFRWRFLASWVWPPSKAFPSLIDGCGQWIRKPSRRFMFLFSTLVKGIYFHEKNNEIWDFPLAKFEIFWSLILLPVQQVATCGSSWSPPLPASALCSNQKSSTLATFTATKPWVAKCFCISLSTCWLVTIRTRKSGGWWTTLEST